MRPCAAKVERADEVGHRFPKKGSEGVGFAVLNESHTADEEAADKAEDETVSGAGS